MREAGVPVKSALGLLLCVRWGANGDSKQGSDRLRLCFKRIAETVCGKLTWAKLEVGGQLGRPVQ